MLPTKTTEMKNQKAMQFLISSAKEAGCSLNSFAEEVTSFVLANPGQDNPHLRSEARYRRFNLVDNALVAFAVSALDAVRDLPEGVERQDTDWLMERHFIGAMKLIDTEWQRGLRMTQEAKELSSFEGAKLDRKGRELQSERVEAFQKMWQEF